MQTIVSATVWTCGHVQACSVWSTQRNYYRIYTYIRILKLRTVWVMEDSILLLSLCYLGHRWIWLCYRASPWHNHCPLCRAKYPRSCKEEGKWQGGVCQWSWQVLPREWGTEGRGRDGGVRCTTSATELTCASVESSPTGSRGWGWGGVGSGDVLYVAVPSCPHHYCGLGWSRGHAQKVTVVTWDNHTYVCTYVCT